MRTRPLTAARRLSLTGLLAVISACNQPPVSHADETDSSDNDGESGTDAQGCPHEVHEGDISVGSDEDFAALMTGVTEVTGHLIVGQGVSNLDEASCLERVGGLLRISGSDLTDLSGFEALEGVGRLELTDNSELTSIKLPALREVQEFDLDPEGHDGFIHIYGNHSLVEIDLDALESVGNVNLGFCHALDLDNLEDVDIEGNDALSTLPGFPSLTHAGLFVLTGQSAVHSADAFIAADASRFSGVSFMLNENLDVAELHALWADAGLPADTLHTCGNAGDTEPCMCAWGE